MNGSRGRTLTGLTRFGKLIKEAEHFCCWYEKKVAKIVQCGEHYPYIHEATEGACSSQRLRQST